VSGLNELLALEGVIIKPLFGLNEERLRLKTSPATESLQFSRFYRLYAPDDQLKMLAEEALKEPGVEAAYIKPVANLPIWFRDIAADLDELSLDTGDFRPLQGYLNKAELGGIDADFASGITGGDGNGINIIDIERAWRFSHEDLRVNCGGVVGGIEIDELLTRNHGTAVLGIVSGDQNKFGITGICPGANIRGVSEFGPLGWGTSAAIMLAADLLNPGDIILLELQRDGPNGLPIPIEWWPDEMVAIKYATNDRKVLVVEAGGNGGQDLDDPIYDVGPDLSFSRFPSGWQNPFKRGAADTHSIIVGAGIPPVDAPGISSFPEFPARARHLFSNFGSAFDAQGWGERVVSCGFGDLPGAGGTDEDFWYTETFSGTSSATPMVAGALACMQGILKANGLEPLTPLQARELLRDTGSPQQDHPASPVSQRIGNQPDLKQMIKAVLSPD
jgi:subtilisin family serine protease